MNVWLVDDCDYVAALTADQAAAWYRRQVFTTPEGRPCAFAPDVLDVQGPVSLDRGAGATLLPELERRLAAGVSFPCMLGTRGGL